MMKWFKIETDGMKLNSFKKALENINKLPLRKRVVLFCWVRLHNIWCIISGNTKRFIKAIRED